MVTVYGYSIWLPVRFGLWFTVNGSALGLLYYYCYQRWAHISSGAKALAFAILHLLVSSYWFSAWITFIIMVSALGPV